MEGLPLLNRRWPEDLAVQYWVCCDGIHSTALQ